MDSAAGGVEARTGQPAQGGFIRKNIDIHHGWRDQRPSISTKANDLGTANPSCRRQRYPLKDAATAGNGKAAEAATGRPQPAPGQNRIVLRQRMLSHQVVLFLHVIRNASPAALSPGSLSPPSYQNQTTGHQHHANAQVDDRPKANVNLQALDSLPL